MTEQVKHLKRNVILISLDLWSILIIKNIIFSYYILQSLTRICFNNYHE